jgi:hypothetical protein
MQPDSMLSMVLEHWGQDTLIQHPEVEELLSWVLRNGVHVVRTFQLL